MSTGEKVERVAETKDEFGLNRSLEVIARRWPEYGYRRTTIALREEMGKKTNQKVVRRLHQSWDLALLRNTKRPKPSRLRRIIRKVGKRANLVANLEQSAYLRSSTLISQSCPMRTEKRKPTLCQSSIMPVGCVWAGRSGNGPIKSWLWKPGTRPKRR